MIFFIRKPNTKILKLSNTPLKFSLTRNITRNRNPKFYHKLPFLFSQKLEGNILLIVNKVSKILIKFFFLYKRSSKTWVPGGRGEQEKSESFNSGYNKSNTLTKMVECKKKNNF